MDGVRSVFPARGRIYRYTCGLASESGSGIAPGRHSDLASRGLSPGNRCNPLPGDTGIPYCHSGQRQRKHSCHRMEIAGHGHMGACSRKTVCLPCRLGRRYIRHFRSGKQAEHDAGAGSG